MAQLHRHGRVLPKWTTADLDWLVCAASAALVSCWLGRRYPGDGIRTHLAHLSAPPLPLRALLYSHMLGSRGDHHGQLLLSQLPSSLAWHTAGRRSLLVQVRS